MVSVAQNVLGEYRSVEIDHNFFCRCDVEASQTFSLVLSGRFRKADSKTMCNIE